MDGTCEGIILVLHDGIQTNRCLDKSITAKLTNLNWIVEEEEEEEDKR